jgi:anthranilate synthase/aminodeoxychorismate synthase-like glutamine amidotransferase
MVLLIDNYDSFVYNLGRYVGQLGYERAIYRHDAITLEQIISLAPTHIIISPGPCTPNEAGITLKVIHYFAARIPILGVCLGHQAIGQAFGGQVVRAIKPMHGMSCHISHTNQGILRNLPNPLRVARYHSLVIRKDHFPDSLLITAYSPEQEIMALQHKTYPIFGVQFHPESVLTEYGYELLRNFLAVTP